MQAQLTDRGSANVVGFAPRAQRAETELPEAVRLIVENLGAGVEAELVRGTFAALMGQLDGLQAVGSGDVAASPVKESVAAFGSVQGGVLDLVSHIETQVLLLEDISKSPGRELLDVAFALRHELRRAFDMDIAEIDHGRPFESAEGRVAHAHGVLRNCFRQCVVLLAQAYEPSLSERTVFADAASRLEESIILRDALASLLASVQEESKKSFPQSAVGVIEQLDKFRREGMSFLMRRDWEMFDAFENELVAAKDAGEFDYATKKLLVGLETLLGQVRMRAVFSEKPPAPATRGFGLLRALGSVRPATWSAVAASLLLAGGLAFFADTTLVTRGSQIAPTADAAAAPQTVAAKQPEPAKQPVPAKPVEPAKPAEVVKPVEAAKPEAAAPQTKQTGGALTLQVGAFRDGAAASESAARLNKHGVEARVAKAQKDGHTIYRVQAGSFNADADAERFGKQLRAKGLAQSFIVTRIG